MDSENSETSEGEEQPVSFPSGDVWTELTRTPEGVGICTFYSTKRGYGLVDESHWTWAEFTGIDTTVLPISIESRVALDAVKAPRFLTADLIVDSIFHAGYRPAFLGEEPVNVEDLGSADITFPEREDVHRRISSILRALKPPASGKEADDRVPTPRLTDIDTVHLKGSESEESYDIDDVWWDVDWRTSDSAEAVILPTNPEAIDHPIRGVEPASESEEPSGLSSTIEITDTQTESNTTWVFGVDTVSRKAYPKCLVQGGERHSFVDVPSFVETELEQFGLTLTDR